MRDRETFFERRHFRSDADTSRVTSTFWLWLAFLGAVLPAISSAQAVSQNQMSVGEEGSIHIPTLVLPDSSLLSPATKQQLATERSAAPEAPDTCGDISVATAEQGPAIRRCSEEAFLKSASFAKLKQQYPFDVRDEAMGGVPVQVITAKGEATRKNARRVLINLHGGGFYCCSRTASLSESAPIAVTSGIKIVSVDYRQSPEAAFPAASEDVEKVYRALLKSYRPQQIGIFGCSAGGLLTAEAIAWFQSKNLPRPGAVAMLCEGAAYWTEGDSGFFLTSSPDNFAIEPFSFNKNPYFKTTDKNNPLAVPIRSKEIMGKFPPSLLIAGTRDFALSSVVNTHAMLISQGISADLHVWEGMGHAFFYDLDLPESKEVYRIVSKFFDDHLAR